MRDAESVPNARQAGARPGGCSSGRTAAWRAFEYPQALPLLKKGQTMVIVPQGMHREHAWRGAAKSHKVDIAFNSKDSQRFVLDASPSDRRPASIVCNILQNRPQKINEHHLKLTNRAATPLNNTTGVPCLHMRRTSLHTPGATSGNLNCYT